MPAEVTVKEIAPCKKQFQFFVSPEDIKVAYDKSVKEVAQTISLPGFRKGKVPKKIIEKRFSSQLESEVQGQIVSDEYHKALDDNKWKALADPKVENLSFDREEGFKFEATVEVYPELEISHHKGVKLNKPKVEVTDEEITKAIDSLREERATLEDSKEASVEGDHLTVKAEFVKEGEAILTRDHAHLRAGQDYLADLTVKGLGEAVIGKKPGEDVEFDVELDESFPEEAHRGSKVTVKLNVEELKTVTLPEVDEAFLKPLQVKDEAELKERITETITSQKESQNEEAMCEEMLDIIAKDLEIPIPEDLLKRQSGNLLQQSEAVYKIMSVPEDEREKFVEEEMEKLKEPASIQVRNFFILDAIANKEKIFVTEKEMAEHIYRMAMSQGKSPEAVTEELRDNGGLAEIRMGLRERKALKWLLEKADITEEGGAAPKKKAKKKASKAKEDASE